MQNVQPYNGSPACLDWFVAVNSEAWVFQPSNVHGRLNDNYLKLKAGYLFPEIGRRVKAFCDANPEAAKRLIRCGIGDVTEPLPPAAIAAMHKAVDEMAVRETFHGYGPEQGYEWLRAAIAQNDFRDRGCDVADDEIFVSDGSKCDTRQHPRHPRRAKTKSPSATRFIRSMWTRTSWPATPARRTKPALTRSSFICRASRATVSFPNRRSGTWT